MQNFYILLKRVSASSLIGVVVMLLMVACPEPDSSGGDTTSATPPKSPTLNSVTRLENEGGVKVDFIESSSADVEYTLITATSIPGPDHTGTNHIVKLKVLSGSVRGSVKSVKLLGLKSNQEYNITIAAVTKVGVESTPQPELAKKATTDKDKIPPRVRDIIGFVIYYKLDADTTKVTWNTSPALVGIHRIEVIAKSEFEESAVKSEPIDPNDTQEVLLEGLESEKVTTKEINIFYRLYDVNGNSSQWIKVGSTALGAVIDPFATEDGEALTVTAMPPFDVDEGRIKYTLYYAKIGGDGVSGYAGTEVIKNKVEEPSVVATIAGKVEIIGNDALATGFTVEGISKDTIYRYFIRSIHPDDEEQYTDTSEALAFVLQPIKNIVIPNTKTIIDTNEYKWTEGMIKITHVFIPDSVTSIGEGAFAYNKLTSVIIPNSVKSIAGSAFYSNKIKQLTIPASITDLGIYAFANNQLEKVEILASLITIKKGVFNNNKIKELTLPDSITDIGMQAFENNKIEEITLPSKLEIIGNNAFYRNEIKALKMPNTVKTIGESAFENNKIEEITLPSKLETIGKNAFKKNKILVLKMPNSVTTMGEEAFRENAITMLTLSNSLTTISPAAFFKNKIEEVELPASVTTVEAEAFSDNKITSLTVSKAVTHIKRRAFMENEIEELTLSEGLMSLGNGAFQNNKITRVKIPKSVTRVGSHAFNLNKKLTSVTLKKSLFDSFKSQKELGDVFVKDAQYFDYENKLLTKVVLSNKNKPLPEKLGIKETKRKALLDKKKKLEKNIKELQIFLNFGMKMVGDKNIEEASNKQKSELEKVEKELRDLDKLNSARKEIVKPRR